VFQHGPDYPRRLVRDGHGRDIRRTPSAQLCQPHPGLSAPAHDGAAAVDQKAAQIAVSALADPPKPVDTTCRVLSRNQAKPSGKVAAGAEVVGIAYRRNQRRRGDDADARDRHQPPAGLVLASKIDKVGVDGREPLGDLLQFFHKMQQGPPRGHRKAHVGFVADYLNQDADAVGAIGSDDAEFREVSADAVDQLCPLARQHLSHAMQHEDFLLALFLDRNEPHRRPGHGLANGLRIGRVVLVGLHIGLNILRRQQADLVAEAANKPAPVVRAGTSLKADTASGQFTEERLHLLALQSPAKNRLAALVRSMDLEDGLGDVEPNECDPVRHGETSFRCMNRLNLRQRLRFGERRHPCHHVRRRFVKRFESDGSPIAEEMLRQIALLYQIEKSVRGKEAAVRLAARREHSAPIIAALKPWLEAQLSRIPQKSQLAEDIRYTLAHWPGLIRFLDDGMLELDTNPVENQIRPIALTRKNALFAGNEIGAENWAMLASLVATCKMSDVNPVDYVAATLRAILDGHPQSDIEDLMPWRFNQPASIAA
jgi:hypothetical protein